MAEGNRRAQGGARPRATSRRSRPTPRASRPEGRRGPSSSPRKGPSSGPRQASPSGSGSSRRGWSLPLTIVGSIALSALIVVVVLFALSFTTAFAIRDVQAVGTSHLSGEDIENLAGIQNGTSILGLDVEGVRSRVSQNPWVASVDVDRNLNGTVTITVTERRPFAVVVMDSSEVSWYLSEDGVWLEPADARPVAGRTIFEVALDEARTRSLLLISDVPATVSPQAGAPCTDEAILAVLDYQASFDEDLASQIAYYDAPDESSISCVLTSGIEVSLGAPKDIAAKNTVILALLAEYPNQITYINARVPSRPTFRRLDSGPTGPGSGLYGGDDSSLATGSAKGAQGPSDDGNSTLDEASGDEASSGY